jgi:hypothetical protein
MALITKKKIYLLNTPKSRKMMTKTNMNSDIPFEEVG